MREHGTDERRIKKVTVRNEIINCDQMQSDRPTKDSEGGGTFAIFPSSTNGTHRALTHLNGHIVLRLAQQPLPNDGGGEVLATVLREMREEER